MIESIAVILFMVSVLFFYLLCGFGLLNILLDAWKYKEPMSLLIAVFSVMLYISLPIMIFTKASGA